jgi:uncharacterized protein YecT (DUF1311 family)
MSEKYFEIMKTRLIFMIFLLSFLVLIGCGGKDGNSINIKQNKEIDGVKNGVLELDKTVTVGNALEGYKYFSKKEWRLVEDPQKRKTVEFLGTLDLASVYEKLEPKLKENLLSTVNDCVYYIKFNMSADNQSFSLASGGEKVSFKNGKIREENYDASTLLRMNIIQDMFQNKMISFDCANQNIVERYIAFPLTQEERDKLSKKYSELDSKIKELYNEILSHTKSGPSLISRTNDRDNWFKERDAKCNAQSGESTKLNCLISMTEQQIRQLESYYFNK